MCLRPCPKEHINYSYPGVDCKKSLVVANIKNMSYHVEKLSLKSGLHTVGRIPENACDDASKRILKLSNID